MRIERSYFNEEIRLRDESIFTCASGNLGVRGNFEEGCPDDRISIRGTYINGFCDTETITYNEKLFGFPESKQTIVNLPDAQGIEIYADGEKLCCWSNKVSDYGYVLDMENGLVSRFFTYDTGKGKINVSFKRLTSFVRQGLFTIRCVIKLIDFNGNIEIRSTLNGNVKNFTNSSDPRVASGSGKMIKVNSATNILLKEKLQRVEVETINSHRKLSACVVNKLFKDNENIDFDYDSKDNVLIAIKSFDVVDSQEIVVDKYCFYQEIIDDKDSHSALLKAVEDGFDAISNEQKEYMSNFWNSSRVLIDSDEIRQEHMDLCLYVMLCSAGRDGKTSIAAKGLSGEGYEGHYFWDCETYIYPFFLNTNQEIAKSLLEYRYSKLDEARKHAQTLGHKKGALYPWRTITGSECSSYFPSGSAQYHINGDIARAFIQYWNVTHDYEFLPKICEVLLETSRLWIDLGHYVDDSFRIDCVTGPDEYTCMVNNNYYTNAGAAFNLRNASRLIRILMNTNEFEKFVENTNFNIDELDAFDQASLKMYLPYDEKLDIVKQDDSFLNKKKLDLNSVSKEDFPMLLNYHPLYLYRHQVCKQADAVLSDYLYGGLSSSTSMKTFEYYEACTTHDSSLSKCIFGNMAVRLGDLNKAKEYFIETLATDINDRKGNTRDGLHMANMAGCYDMIVGGFAGLRIDDEELSLFPMIPEGINSYEFCITYRGKRISVYVDSSVCKVHTDSDEIIDIYVYGKRISINNNEVEISRTCKGVIFDLDGVITDTAIYHYQAWKRIADELGIEFDEKKNEEFKGVSRKTCLELLLGWGNRKVSENEFNELLERKNNYYKDLLKQLTPSNILPGILDAIETLHNNGIKVALFSVSKNTEEILRRLEIENVFDAVVSGSYIKHSKPHFEGYLLAADKLQIEPRLCAMVEDSVFGINGAKALSMKTIAIMNENKANADVCISSTKELDKIMNYL